MNPNTLNSETHITKIEVENEIKTTQSKKTTNSLITPVKYSELLRQDNAKECTRSAEITKGVDGNASVANVQVCGKLFTSTNVYKMEMGDTKIKKGKRNSKKKKPLFYPTDFWVQFNDGEVEEPLDYTPDRNSFVAKVFLITFIMLIVTAAFVGFVVLSDDMRELFAETILGALLCLVAAIIMIILNYYLICSPCMRMFPCNFLMLFIAVGCMSIISAYITAHYDTQVIVYALIATAVTVFACLLLAMTSFDFTAYILYVFVIGIAFMVLSVSVSVASVALGIRMPLVHLVLLFVATILNVIVLIMELQMILGGKAVQLSEDEYPLGAYMLYTSIVDLFLKMVQILGIFMSEEELF
ncbi:hypothetical protein PYW08_010069 [Mythimna loreyi]|uniref:Uncharacterized protein n=1 Tax=Mythimna loreyi TaxID=667449 RepID=A0ACC2Q817_9NEOP|nr:hypothetical protein PYW08_010069 [Mythimna loreyi]